MSPLFFTVVIIEILAGAELDLFIPSFPELQSKFELSPFMVQLTVSANFIPYCVFSLLAGILGDRFDRRHVILASLVIFVLGSLLCVFAFSFTTLVLGRFLQGTGMAGPAILAFVVLADKYPLEKQPAMLGMINGITNLAMTIAPVIGSYVNLYYNWRGNFCILLILGMVSLIASYFVIPNKSGNSKASLSLKSYWVLFSSRKLMFFVMAICLMTVSYWTFIGMAPILYMEGMGINLKYFGLYQGSLAGAFSIISILSPKLLTWYGQKKCLYYSLFLYIFSVVVLFFVTMSGIQDPMVITGVMIIYAIAAVFPVNILYPISLEVIENSKSRIAALINGIKLLGIAFTLELISYFYVGRFLPLGSALLIMLTLGLFLVWKIFHQGWAHISIDSYSTGSAKG